MALLLRRSARACIAIKGTVGMVLGKRFVGNRLFGWAILAAVLFSAALGASPSHAADNAGAALRWALVSGSNVNVRAQPDISGERIGAHRRGTRLQILRQRVGWVQVREPVTGAVGWMSADFVRMIPVPQPVAAVRSRPRRVARGAVPKQAPLRRARPRLVQPPAIVRTPRVASLAKPAQRKQHSRAVSGPRLDLRRRYRMVVYGDSLATNVFHGLQGYARRAGFYTVKRRTRGGTGLIRDDQYDWYERTLRFLREDRPDIVVVTFGGNDRQSLSSGRLRLKRFSERWWREYRRRVDRYMAALKRATPHVYWVGLPVVRSGRMTRDYAKFNRVYRTYAAKHGVVFVDTFDRFQADGGGYTSAGADIDGGRRTLRTSDGIHFNGAGGQVLAQLVVAAIRRQSQVSTARR